MITWNLDPTSYTISQLTSLLIVVEQMDTSIAREISDYISEQEVSESSKNWLDKAKSEDISALDKLTIR